MTRLLKKCFFISVGLHVLLVAALILGAAFFVTQPEKVPPVLSMIAPNVLEDLLNPPTPPQSKPNLNQPSATRHPEVTPPRPPVKPVIQPPKPRPNPPKPQPKTPKVKPKPRPKNPNPNKPKPPNSAKKPKDIKVNIHNTQKHTNHTRPKPRPVNPVINSKDVNNALKGLSNLSAKIKVQVSGSNRAAFATYAQHVVAVYRRAWQPLIPKNLARIRIAEVSVTIDRNGRVISARIVRRTGDAALDKSVQRALDKVKSVGKSFPSGSRDAKRTFILDFTPIIGG
ncbi:MAG: TonB family protein [Verrucomicrobia subdivision 3 bacterium]|nr:TonB family protein [Limisphaerales bacterium]